MDWQNLVFAIPLALTLVLGVLAATGILGSGGDGDHDADHDADADHYADHDADADADQDADHDADDASVGGQLASLLGIGRAPLTLVLASFFGLFGIVGLLLNRTLEQLAGRGVLAFSGALLGALVASVAGTRALSSVVGRALPKVETYVARGRDFEGLIGDAETAIDARGGLVRVKDPHGTVQQLRCVVRDDAPIARSARVLLVEYDPSSQTYFVKPAPRELTEPTESAS